MLAAFASSRSVSLRFLALLLFFFSVLCLPARTAPPTEQEVETALKLFLNLKEDILQRCVYRPSERDIVMGSLKALQREMGPEFATHFPEDRGGTFQEALRVYRTTILTLAQAPTVKSSVKNLVERSVKGYCRTLDRYCDYDDLASWQSETKIKRPDYVGVGMTIERTPEGYDCYPFPGGPADLAGCDAGDRLLEVDGKPVRGLTMVDVATLIVGKEGTVVRLKVRQRDDGKERVLSVNREPIKLSFIEVLQSSKGSTVRLRRLNDQTVQDLRAFLRTLKPGEPLTLDLRGCPGGDLSAAVAISSMFLPSGTVIGRLETLQGKETFQSENPAPYRPGKLIILQDKGTMSGAELITMALVSSSVVKAESRGERTYGKGVTIAEVAVEGGGGRLRITDARIYGPRDEFWDGEGLNPTVEGELPPQ